MWLKGPCGVSRYLRRMSLLQMLLRHAVMMFLRHANMQLIEKVL